MFTGLLDMILGDETRHWPPPAGEPLTLDVARQSLNRAKLADPPDRLREFGRPADRRPIASGKFHYPAQGVAIYLGKDGRVMSFGVAIDESPEIPRGFRRSPSLTLAANGRSVEVRAGMTLPDLAARLGVVPKEDRDEEEIIASFQAGGAECEIECELDGRVRWVTLYRV